MRDDLYDPYQRPGTTEPNDITVIIRFVKTSTNSSKGFSITRLMCYAGNGSMSNAKHGVS